MTQVNVMSPFDIPEKVWIWNPYVEELRQRGILDAHGRMKSGDYLLSDTRHELVQKYAWAIPTSGLIAAAIGFSPKWVEIGAGGGYWARALTEAGAVVHAYDDFSWRDQRKYPQQKWYDVKKGGPAMAGKHPDAALLLVWPPYEDPMGVKAVRAYLKAGGKRVLYVGEGKWGCTGDDALHEMLDEKFDLVEPPRPVNVLNWSGLKDNAYFYMRR